MSPTTTLKKPAAKAAAKPLASANATPGHAPAADTLAFALEDYRLAVLSREASLLGRKEVFMGKAKFGIFGDGKEVAQLAMARAFKNGDWRAGYYRDQTFMFAAGLLTVQQYFAQLYAHTSIPDEPASGGRLMNGHFATRLLDEAGNWLPQTDRKNSSSDISPTGGQMPRLLGLAYASKLYRQFGTSFSFDNYSTNGNEIAFGTIGNASTSEGLFYETINAAGVLQVPLFISVWDDEYGISVSKEYHTTKGSISAVLAGFQRTGTDKGFEVVKVSGWDYPALVAAYQEYAHICRTQHVPVLMHVVQLTQPQGHSTSGSHERYKSKERLGWEAEYDCNLQMRNWLLLDNRSTNEELMAIESAAKKEVQAARNAAWAAYRQHIEADKADALAMLACVPNIPATIQAQIDAVATDGNSNKADIYRQIRRANAALAGADKGIAAYVERVAPTYAATFNSLLDALPAANVAYQLPTYSADSPMVDGREILVSYFDSLFSSIPSAFAIGEDIGKIGDVNQGMAGLQAKFGEHRITDTGIREATIMGQGIGAALRGLHPIVEIQYLDYLLYALQILSDDVACLSYRTAGGQKAPLIIRTRGHRLEGMWHSGSPMGMIIHALRGINIVVPRSMVQAAGFYTTCIALGQPSLVIEPLNGYRVKEQLPDNLSTIALPLGVPEVLVEGSDITVVTYGSMCKIVQDAAAFLSETLSIYVEVIDVRTLLPFDTTSLILQSLKKTNRIIFADEDVPGGASAFMLQQVLEQQGGYRYLDSAPTTIAAKAHRPAYGTDGDYFSKPSAEDIIEAVVNIMAEAYPHRFNAL